MCREPGVKELTDGSFEHLTQAATGATTGDWLVLFYTDDCTDCHKMMAGLESVSCQHKGRVNVAKVRIMFDDFRVQKIISIMLQVNKQTHGEKTGRRFQLGLDSNPVLIL